MEDVRGRGGGAGRRRGRAVASCRRLLLGHKRMCAPQHHLLCVLATTWSAFRIPPLAARRRLAEAAAGNATATSDEAPILAFALSDGPIIIPEEVDPQHPERVAQALGLTSAPHTSTDDALITLTGLGDTAAPAAAPSGAASPAGAPQVDALAAGDDCSAMRWRVESAAYRKQAPLQPADLWSAQLARRRASK